MKKIILSFLLLFAINESAFAIANQMRLTQRDPTDMFYISRDLAIPAGGDGLFFFNGTTLLPQLVTVGDGLQISGNQLISTVPAGPQGPAGDVGPAGAKGDKGDTGATGEAGAIGPVGPAGAAGLAGATGPTGVTGSAGPKGDTGATGATGAQGTPGLTSFGTPSTRSVSLATAYQCSDTAKPCFVTVTLQSQSSISLTGASNNEGAIVIGSTSAVAAGTGAAVATYKNNLGGALVVGLNLNSQQANTYTVALPAGWYFAVRQTAGTGLSVVSAFDQGVN